MIESMARVVVGVCGESFETEFAGGGEDAGGYLAPFDERTWSVRA